MAAEPTFVIAGASLAGAKAAEALRGEGFSGRIVLIGSEHLAPYERPPLSKAYLQNKADVSTVYVHEPDWYAENSVDLLLSRTVTAIHRERHEVVVEGGLRGEDWIRYDKLLLATGSSPRRLPLPGAHLDVVMYLRTLEESDRLRTLFPACGRLLIIGAGWIGLEVAAAAREAGVEVTVLEAAEQPLLRVLGPQIAPVFARLHRDHGVDLRLGARIAQVVGVDGRATGVRMADGSLIEADFVLAGVGVEPNAGFAQAAGLPAGNGVVVDASLRTEDPDIFAAGDVANAYHPLLRRHIRVEHWANALNQPAVAALSMLGRPATYERVPYFFTDQYDLGMEYSGYVTPDGYDRVAVRGDLDGREFIAFWLSGGRVRAGMNVNVWDVTDPIQRLIRSGAAVDVDVLTDTGVPLEEIADAADRAGRIPAH